VEYRLDSEQTYTSQDYAPANLTDSTHYLTVSGLTSGRTYMVRIAAANEAGVGPVTSDVTFEPLSGQLCNCSK